MAAQKRADAHDTSLNSFQLPGSGVGSTDHLSPFQRSASAADVLPIAPTTDPTAVHADADVHETDISWPGPGGVGETVQLGAAAQPALTAPSEAATHAPAATQRRRARAVGRRNWPLRTTSITPPTSAEGQMPDARDASTTLSPDRNPRTPTTQTATPKRHIWRKAARGAHIVVIPPGVERIVGRTGSSAKRGRRVTTSLGSPGLGHISVSPA